MSAAVIASFGLMLNMVGVTIAFVFGYPQPAHEEGIGLGLEDALLLRLAGGASKSLLRFLVATRQAVEPDRSPWSPVGAARA